MSWAKHWCGEEGFHVPHYYSAEPRYLGRGIGVAKKVFATHYDTPKPMYLGGIIRFILKGRMGDKIRGAPSATKLNP